MNTIKPTATDTWDSFAWTLMSVFLLRNGWHEDDVKWEVNFLKECGWNVNMREVDLKDSYYPKVRLGATKRVSRLVRRGIMFTYMNACNHASVHFHEMKS